MSKWAWPTNSSPHRKTVGHCDTTSIRHSASSSGGRKWYRTIITHARHHRESRDCDGERLTAGWGLGQCDDVFAGVKRRLKLSFAGPRPRPRSHLHHHRNPGRRRQPLRSRRVHLVYQDRWKGEVSTYIRKRREHILVPGVHIASSLLNLSTGNLECSHYRWCSIERRFSYCFTV